MDLFRGGVKFHQLYGKGTHGPLSEWSCCSRSLDLRVPGTMPHASWRWWWSRHSPAYSEKSLSQPPFLFAVVQRLSHGPLLATPWTAARQTSLSCAISWNLLKLMSIESVMPSNHPILYCLLLLLLSIFPSIRVFSNELALLVRWPKQD